MGSSRLQPPAAWSAQERGWWWSLFWAMFNADPQGYLAITSDIWTVAGAHDRQRWESRCARVMASFDVSDIAGQQVLFFPPLIEVLKEQRSKLLKTRARFGIKKSASESGSSLSLLILRTLETERERKRKTMETQVNGSPQNQWKKVDSIKPDASAVRHAPPDAELDELVEVILARWPNHKLDDQQLLIYYDDLFALKEECGIKALTAAVYSARTRKGFLPGPDELRELMPAREQYVRQEWERPDCPDCKGSGWKMVEVPSKIYVDRKELAARRCDCLLPYMRKKATSVTDPPFIEAEFA